MKEHAMKTLLLGVVAAAAILGAAPASAEYREVRIVRDWDPPWHHRPWYRHFAWGGCRDVTERRYQPDGTVVVRRIHRC
jgi:Ni/Co efflux regulator RcnB